MDTRNDKAFILIDKFHSGQATQDEVASLKEWKNLSHKNTKLFNDLISLLNLISNLKDWRQFDQGKAWKRFQAKLGRKGFRISRQLMAIAAVFIFVLAATVYNFSGRLAGIEASYISGASSKFSMLLDGSELFPDNNAKIFTDNFAINNRFLRTEGDFFVHVARNESAPFTMETERVSIKVLGTSFKVEEDEDETIVKVRDGKVLITSYDGAEYKVTAGQKFSIKNRKVTLGKVVAEDWGLFAHSYEDESLFVVINDLAEEYSNLKFNPSGIDQTCRITTKISQSTIIEILDEMALIFDVRYIVEDGVVTIEHISC